MNSSGDILLDPNHTHFIFVDDGSEGQFGKEIKFRARLEHELRKGRTLKYYENKRRTGGGGGGRAQQGWSPLAQPVSSDIKESKELIPMILIVVNGGPNTLLTVVESLKEAVPVLVLAVGFIR